MNDLETASEHSKAQRPTTRRVGQRLLIVGAVGLVSAVLAAANGLWVLANICGAVAVVLLMVGGTNTLLGKDD